MPQAAWWYAHARMALDTACSTAAWRALVAKRRPQMGRTRIASHTAARDVWRAPCITDMSALHCILMLYLGQDASCETRYNRILILGKAQFEPAVRVTLGIN